MQTARTATTARGEPCGLPCTNTRLPDSPSILFSLPLPTGRYGDDVGGISKGLFLSIYKASTTSRRSLAAGSGDGGSSSDEADCEIPAQIKFAASMSELQRMALEERFSDDEGDDDGESGSEDGSAGSESVVVPTEGAFARVSRILFGTATSPPQRQKPEPGDESSSSEEDDDD